MTDLRSTIQATQDAIGGTFLIRHNGKEEDWTETISKVRVPPDPYTPLSFEFSEVGVPLKIAAESAMNPAVGHPTWQRRAVHGLVVYDLYTIKEMALEFADTERKAWGVCGWLRDDESSQRPHDAPADLRPELFPFWNVCLYTQHAGTQCMRMVKETFPPAPAHLMPRSFYLPHDTLLHKVVFVDLARK